MRGGGIRAVSLVATAVLVLGACSGGGDGDADRDGQPAGQTPNAPSPAGADEELPELPAEFTEQELAWEPCGAPTPLQGSGAAPAPGWECADLTVPLDYADPGNGETIDIAVIRARSAGGSGHLGSLVFNFGGPGGSGVATLPRTGDRYAALFEAYDLVSFDPRGVGESAGVVCRSDAEIDASAQEDHGPPRTPAEERAFLTDSREYADACRTRAGDLLPHISTENTARDLDLLRLALGDGRLNYFGISYGTKLGGVYAHLFPDNVGRMVLDAVVDPTRDVVERGLLQTEGFQRALDHYLADCAEQPDCPTGAGGQEGYDVINGLLEELRAEPLPTDTDRQLTRGLAFTALLSALYSEGSWPFLTDALRQALDEGRGDLMLAAAEQYNGRDSQGRYRNVGAANNAVNCGDFASRPATDTVHEHLDEFRAASPVFGETLAWSIMACAHWPVTGEQDQPEVAAPGARPILLLGTTGDPATPLVGAERMRDALGEGVGVLLTYDGEGHGAHSSGDDCVVEAVNAHLLAGSTPDDGTVCP
ncbi:alpha/beta hydrolase [Streptomyces sp. DSM 44938]|uniref:Alpha/beta hydrolase n=2 Tax=Streptomyces litchfieldiae TaxID=3075543 RepID=A0ABU2MLR2_9ACTN|nr:alpha/beta hydrolase [Streptomyces sp. DSM 44938]MDT0342545.1 alpha/beta hydrolase [Streptomyces sp. DSM 44938]